MQLPVAHHRLPPVEVQTTFVREYEAYREKLKARLGEPLRGEFLDKFLIEHGFIQLKWQGTYAYLVLRANLVATEPFDKIDFELLVYSQYSDPEDGPDQLFTLKQAAHLYDVDFERALQTYERYNTYYSDGH